MSRSATATLSPSEINALRRVESGLANFLPPTHRDVLISMGLIAQNFSERLVLTETGRQRLRAENEKTSPLGGDRSVTVGNGARRYLVQNRTM